MKVLKERQIKHARHREPKRSQTVQKNIATTTKYFHNRNITQPAAFYTNLSIHHSKEPDQNQKLETKT